MENRILLVTDRLVTFLSLSVQVGLKKGTGTSDYVWSMRRPSKPTVSTKQTQGPLNGFKQNKLRQKERVTSYKNSKIHKVRIFWEGHKILRNLHLTFDWHYIGQK